jgi:Tfp pilus assembly protein PilF
LTTAMELDDTYTPALVDLAECRAQAGQTDEAWALYEAARELNPRDPELLYSIGRFLRDKGSRPAAVAAYRTAIEQLVTLPILNSTEK